MKQKGDRFKKAAHFLLIPELLCSPPNDALIKTYIENGYRVDVFSPGYLPEETGYGPLVRTFPANYSWLWLFRNIIKNKWLNYRVMSGTSEDPLAIVGVLSFLYRKRSISLVDEIKSDSYSGDRSVFWKRVCRWAIRKSNIRIVNDFSRVDLLKKYAGLSDSTRTIVYPGCFKERPEKNSEIRKEVRRNWNISDREFVVGSSGGFNLTAGAEWLLNALEDHSDLYAVIQPLGVSDLSMFLLKKLSFKNRLFLQESRLGWKDAWISAQGLDAGLCIYTNEASQFQNMGISSNRLCMFIAMGVPVIATRQKSFQFIEDYNCGILVGNYQEFCVALRIIQTNHEVMRRNCEDCFMHYIQPFAYYQQLGNRVKLLG